MELDVSAPVNDTDSVAKNDGMNIIKFGHVYYFKPLAQTTQYPYFAASTFCNKGFTKEIDLIVNDSIAHLFVADTTRTRDLDSAKYDLYAILLHELGNAISLGHNCDTSEYMYVFAKRTEASPIQKNKFN